MPYSQSYRNKKNDEKSYEKEGDLKRNKQDNDYKKKSNNWTTPIEKAKRKLENTKKKVILEDKKTNKENTTEIKEVIITSKEAVKEQNTPKQNISETFTETVANFEDFLPPASVLNQKKEPLSDTVSQKDIFKTALFQPDTGILLRIIAQTNFWHIYPLIAAIVLKIIFGGFPGLFIFAALVFAIIQAKKALERAKFILVKIKFNDDIFEIYYKKYEELFFRKIPKKDFFVALNIKVIQKKSETKLDSSIKIGTRRRQFDIYDKDGIIIQYYEKLLGITNQTSIPKSTHNLLAKNLKHFHGGTLTRVKRMLRLI